MLSEELSMPLDFRSLSIVSDPRWDRHPAATADLLRTLTMVRNHLGKEAQLVEDIRAYLSAVDRRAALEPTDCEAVLEHALADLKHAIEETGAVVTHDPLPTLCGRRLP